MRKSTLIPLALLCGLAANSQTSSLAPLTVDKIMRDPKWIGTSPSNPEWSLDGKYLLFDWNPEKAVSDSVYFITPAALNPQKTTYAFREQVLDESSVVYNTKRTHYVFSRQGDIYLVEVKTGQQRPVTRTTEFESSPRFSFNDGKIVYVKGLNLFAWSIATGETTQLTNFQQGGVSAPSVQAFAGPQRGGGQGGPGASRGNRTASAGNTQEKWLETESIANSLILQSRKEKRELADSMRKALPKEKELRTLSIEDKSLFGTTISTDGRFITYRLTRSASGGKSTIVPNYVTESGFTEDIPGRTKVGAPMSTQELYLYDMQKDTVYVLKTDSIPGIKDLPDYVKDYPAVYAEKTKNPALRAVSYSNTTWAPGAAYAVVDVRSHDNKDRWLLLLDGNTGKYSLLDRQRDEAWIGGPGTSGFGNAATGWVDANTFWYQSEATGYSHLYVYNVATKEKKALTSGQYEVQRTILSKDKKYFYLTTNEVHPGEQHFYRLPVTGGKAERITTMSGANQVTLSPDEKNIAILYSYSNKPWELYLQENKPGGKLQQVTSAAQTDEFKSYPWRDPAVITFKAKDGAEVHARLYRPANPHPAKPAVIFVHGAGYLQNAHKWWSSYFREYMFHNLLADQGYTVLDIDYRGSAGYGRDWRTGIYRHMGGKDLSDQVDGAKYLIEKEGVNPQHIGLYGGSYGGFITLMAMFNASDVFAAGGALRSVTDWAHYNHGYTSNILNEPINDSLAYQRSSPINFAAGLKGHLLMCHGMVDVNVHFQDIVRISQKLIELGKDNWELAVYPVEDHGFVEPSSWADEYKRIFKLFEMHLKK
ncbi:prolyl oligopeptidase family serine peptidase [Paraflavitalea sp. CAU 1676]|uniref:S9 family peptidase n=1 Tax=Paraflavitalea sp. CAU 1676 TaxID=3032598 RepID=UPI0023DBCA71|nr:prolyl oligopeptidase family serine peptidase [Paraflavitalea sp. CAU 1676]MDF2189969.1 prolyl oligopeptidase family serine peptidase [Paraflavitalea sp. CAU 1676]